MNKNIALFSGVAIFVALFYRQEPGINLSLFTLLIWFFLFFTSKKEVHTKEFWRLSAALFVSVGAFAWYGDFISFAALFCSIVIIATRVYKPSLNVLLIPFAAFINFASFIVRAPFIQKWLPINYGTTKDIYKKLFYYFIIPGALIAGFLTVYTFNSNRFQSFFNFNWDINFFKLAFLTGLGFFIMFSFLHYWIPALLLQQEKYFNDQFSPSFNRFATKYNNADINFYRKSGQISLIALNLLVIVFIITYCIEQFGTATTTNNLSEDLHTRVCLLIFSIVMAISVIMLFFKGVLNFNEQSQLLKKLSFVWVGLNIILVFVVALKNNQYIFNYGLTFKRIGVYIFLLLCTTGLVFTLLKIQNKKTNIYLISRMVWTAFTTLVIGAVINWSWFVTDFNLKHGSFFDLEYAKSLEFNKQLLYNRKLIPETEFAKIIENHTRLNFLSQNFYYRNLKTR